MLDLSIKTCFIKVIRKNLYSISIYWILSFLFHNAISQDVKLIDSLEKALVISKIDSNKILILNELSWNLQSSDFKRAINYANLALEISRAINYKEGEATSNNRLGVIEQNKGHFKEALTYYEKALSIEKKIQNEFGIARAYNQIGLINKSLGNLGDAIRYFNNALSIFTKTNNDNSVARTHNNLGSTYVDLGNYKEAIMHFNKALSIRNRLNDRKGLASIYLNMGLLYEKTEDYTKALNYHFQCLDIYSNLNDNYEKAKVLNNLGNVFFHLQKLDEALCYYLESLHIKEALGIYDKMDANYNNLGIIYESRNEYDLALKYFKNSLSIGKVNGNKNELVRTYNNIGNIQKKQGTYNQALSTYLEGLQIAREIKAEAATPELFMNISDTYELIKEYSKALKYKQMYIDVRNNLYEDYISISKLEAKFETEKAKAALLEKDKALQNAELLKTQAQSQRKSVLIYGLVIGIILLGVLILAIIRGNKERQKALIAEKNEAISRQKIKELLTEQENKAMNAMVNGQEKERKRIAQDLHDRLGSILSMVKLHFNSVETSIEEMKLQNREQYEKASELLDEACDEVRRVAHNLSSGVLMKFGLIAALNDLKNSIEKSSNLKINLLEYGFDGRLEITLEIAVYRIIQELISNILKHAQASEVTIQLIHKLDNLNITLEDDGCGFNVDSKDFTYGMGLKGIEARVSEWGGELVIDSGKGNGTIVTINIPINNA